MAVIVGMFGYISCINLEKHFSFDSCEEDIIFTFQQTAEENNEGEFIHEHKNKKTVQYFCER